MSDNRAARRARAKGQTRLDALITNPEYGEALARLKGTRFRAVAQAAVDAKRKRDVERIIREQDEARRAKERARSQARRDSTINVRDLVARQIRKLRAVGTKGGINSKRMVERLTPLNAASRRIVWDMDGPEIIEACQFAAAADADEGYFLFYH